MNFLDRIYPLPLHLFGYENMPAVPLVPSQWLDTLLLLKGRQVATQQAIYGLSNMYTLGGDTMPAVAFLFPQVVAADNTSVDDTVKELHHTLSSFVISLSTKHAGEQPQETPLPVNAEGPLPLTDPAQFAMGWTTFNNVYDSGKPLLEKWSATLTDVATANEYFWRTIADYGLGLNLMIIQKVTEATADTAKGLFSGWWETEGIQALLQAGRLYAIDMTIFSGLSAAQVQGSQRYVPGTYTLLKQDENTKALTPFAIVLSNNSTGELQQETYILNTAKDGAWLYALQAVKASVSVYGIWLGHVWHWHLPTAALQMTMYNELPETHCIYQMLAPQSDYLMAFDNILLLQWSTIAPPTPVTTALEFLTLINTFSAGKTFFGSNPREEMKRGGYSAADFTSPGGAEWDLYPIMKHYLTVWDASEAYVSAFVKAYYNNEDAQVQADRDLQKWVSASQEPSDGNIAGLPDVMDIGTLVTFLTSIVYRITMHGCARLNPVANPALTFAVNFPACLQRTDMVPPDNDISTQELLRYLPDTWTIGGTLAFYFTFSFSAPYKPFLPPGGNGANLFFSDAAANDALVAFRDTIRKLIETLYERQIQSPQYYQWPLNIET